MLCQGEREREREGRNEVLVLVIFFLFNLIFSERKAKGNHIDLFISLVAINDDLTMFSRLNLLGVFSPCLSSESANDEDYQIAL
jgi:hypothetical protein